MYKVALSQYCRQSTLCLVWCEVYYCARTAQLYMAEERGLFLSVLNYLLVNMPVRCNGVYKLLLHSYLDNLSQIFI
jgi:hypothetical protein